MQVIDFEPFVVVLIMVVASAVLMLLVLFAQMEKRLKDLTVEFWQLFALLPEDTRTVLEGDLPREGIEEVRTRI